MVIGEELEWAGSGPLLTHEQEGSIGDETEKCGRGSIGRGPDPSSEPLAKGLVPDLVVIGNTVNELLRIELDRCAAAPFAISAQPLSAEEPTVLQSLSQLGRMPLEVRIVSFAFSLQQHAHDMMEIVR